MVGASGFGIQPPDAVNRRQDLPEAGARGSPDYRRESSRDEAPAHDVVLGTNRSKVVRKGVESLPHIRALGAVTVGLRHRTGGRERDERRQLPSVEMPCGAQTSTTTPELSWKFRRSIGSPHEGHLR